MLRPEVPEPPVPLTLMTQGREVVEDYRSTGLSLRGHPVGFSASYRMRLQSLTGDTGAREILHADSAFVEEIRVMDAGIFLDIDTPTDLER